MSVGYEPYGGQPDGGPGQPGGPAPAPGPGYPTAEPAPPRPGPLPPRMAPPAYPTPPAGPYPPAPAPGPPFAPAPAAHPVPSPGPAPVPSPAPVPAPAPAHAPAPAPWSASPTPGFAPSSLAPAGPASSPPAAVPARRNRLVLGVALLAAVLTVLAGVQAYQIHRLNDRLDATDRRLADGQSGDRARLDGLTGRTEALEKQAGAAFNPEAIASAVLPSVFRVRAGDFTGTAFAVGKPVSGGGTNLFTNFHVVESVWEAGDRKVYLERTDQRFPATIVKVDKENDIAQLRTDGRFTGLVAASSAVKSGQQIVVVGAPLGLEDTVTTGVVSAFRKSEGGSGPVIQFDAPINPGNSGGPVINGSKQVVGIATAKARDAEGIGLAIPIKIACDGFKIC